MARTFSRGIVTGVDPQSALIDQQSEVAQVERPLVAGRRAALTSGICASLETSQTLLTLTRRGTIPRHSSGVAGSWGDAEKSLICRLAAAARFGLLDPSGSSVVELALLTPLLLLLLVGAVDMGRAFYAAIEVSSAANAGAEYGMQNPTDTAGMQEAAILDGADLSNLTAAASWGCECSDGTSASVSCASVPTCSINAVDYVQVTTSMTYVPIVKFPGVPSSLALKGSARMRASE